jgi:hypothetical protein
MRTGGWIVVGLFGLMALVARLAPAAAWTPAAWRDEETLAFRTDCPDEGEHWSTVWLAVVDDQVYVRLGRKASARIACNRSAPYVGVRIGGVQFDRVKTTSVPEHADAVAAGMRAKYWSDLFIAWVPHQLTLRLEPE